MRGIKPKLSISKLSIFGCTVFMRKRGRDVSTLESKALEGKFVCYTEGDNGYLVYVPNTNKVVAVRDMIIEESEVGSIPDTETPDLLDEGHRNTQETTLRRDASDVEEAALDEESIVRRGSLRDS